jgi:DNA-binding transcriptional LysR family regulator
MTIIGLVAAGLGVSILASFQACSCRNALGTDRKDAVSEMWLVWSKHHEQGTSGTAFQTATHFCGECIKWPVYACKTCGKSQG